jgi:hypothetical protein
VTVFVDDMRRPAHLTRRPARWSHMFADTSEELLAFAAALGLQAEWLQHPGTHREHFDVTDTVRERALRAGAVAIRYPRGTAELLERKKAEAGS